MPEDHGGFKATGLIAHKDVIIFGDDDATPDVSGGNYFRCATDNTGPLNITALDGGVTGQLVIIFGFAPANLTTIKDGEWLYISGDWVEGAERTLTLFCQTGGSPAVWKELGRR